MLQMPLLPETPPDLDQIISLSDDQIRQVAQIVAELSSALDSSPVVVSQEGKVITSAGAPTDEAAERIAKLVARIWREGHDRLARELIRFEEEAIDEENERANLMIYSAHIAGGITLTVGWQLALSLTQIRAEVGDVKQQLARMISGDEAE